MSRMIIFEISNNFLEHAYKYNSPVSSLIHSEVIVWYTVLPLVSLSYIGEISVLGHFKDLPGAYEQFF